MSLKGNRAKGILVLDSTPIYSGILQGGMYDECFTTEEILGEIAHIRGLQETVSTRLGSGILKVGSASSDSTRRIIELVGKLGEGKLSKADLSILALTLDLKENGFEPTLVSDDFSIQNLAKSLSLSYLSYTSKGIKRGIVWILYCPACGRTVDRVNSKECEICGSTLKRRPKNRASSDYLSEKL